MSGKGRAKMTDLNCLKELVFKSDNEACFIERERILNRLEKEFGEYNKPDKYALIFSKLMSEVSTPIEDCDYFAGRVVEAKPEEGMTAPNSLLCATGHMSPDYESLLKYGLKGVLEKIKKAAECKNDEESMIFAENAEIVVNAVKSYAKRYAAQAKSKGFDRMANEFSKVVLKAAVMNNMAQPQITVLLKNDANKEFTEEVFAAISKLVDKLHIYNYDLIVNALIKKGISPEDAKKFTFSACCSFDLNYYSYRLEYFTPVLQIFLDVINKKEYSDVETLSKDLTAALKDNIQNDIENKEKDFSDMEYARKYFVLDCLLHTDTTYECIYPCDSGSKYKIFNVFCPGAATLGDSLMVLDKLVFKEKRFSYNEFMKILNNNYENYEELRREILNYTRFGNDSEADKYTVMAANSFLNAVDGLELKENYYAIGGFYSLERDNTWEVKATPDGRKDGEPFSENQSPAYGADKNGITALLKSLSKLPFERTATGGLNLTFSQNVSADILKALAVSYFKLGGFHVGISVVNAETLKDAMKNPDKYKSLTVRLYGFSEYFVSLPKWQQMAVLNRTQYKV